MNDPAGDFANARVRVFIGSSTASRHYAHAIKTLLSGDYFECVVWDERGVFPPSQYPLESLLKQTETCDIAVFVMTADDLAEIKNSLVFAPRDNVVFEAGLFLGVLGRENTFLLTSGDVDLHIPTDLEGLTQLRFASTNATSVEEQVRNACSILNDRYVSLPPTSLPAILGGAWKQTWTVERSDNYPEENWSIAKVAILGSRFRAWFDVAGQQYQIGAAIIGEQLITGRWFGPTDSAYHGACQLRIHPKLSILSGKWVGFRSNLQIEAGKWRWEKCERFTSGRRFGEKALLAD